MENNKKLYRSTKNRMLGGVCGGFAEYLGLDVTIVRLLYLILSIFTACFPGLILYILCLFVIPNEPGFGGTQPETRRDDGDYTDV